LQLVHSLNVGGAERLAERFARRLGGPERVAFACLDELGSMGERLRGDGFMVEVLGRKPGPFDRACLRRLSELYRRERIGLVHAHQMTPFQTAALARGWSAAPRILLTEHGRFFPDRRNWKWYFLNRRLLGKRDRVTAVGEQVKRALVEHEGFPATRVETIYNGVDLGNEPPAETRAEVREELGFNADDFLVLMAARLDPIKDHATAVAAFATFAESRPNVGLLIAGDGPMRSVLDSEAAVGLGSKLKRLGTRDDVRRLLAAVDAVLLTSLSEGIPLILVEAMAARLPAVATAVGGVSEVVVDGETGLLAPAKDAAALARSLAALADDADLRRRLGSAGRRRAEELFDEETMLARYAELHREALS
jgi:glycosyltransferase involved in cell wall biosynthesis